MGPCHHLQPNTPTANILAMYEAVHELGLEQAIKIDRLEIRWPSGATDKLENLPADQFLTIWEGKGIIEPK